MAGSKWTADRIPDLNGRTVVVTGANSGLGLATVRELARHRAHVVLAVRDEDKGRRAAAAISDVQPGARLEVRRLDLADLDSVRAFAAGMHDRGTGVDVLVNNAGVMAPPHTLNRHGQEVQFAGNHLGHFALTGLLLDLLRAGRDPRVVTVTSDLHRGARIHFDDLTGARWYAPMRFYRQSKFANVVFALEFDRRLRAAGSPVRSLLAHPGFSATNLQTSGPTGLLRTSWDVFTEGEIVFLHRSWTGFGIFEATFAPADGGGWQIVGAVVERDPERFRGDEDEYDCLAATCASVHACWSRCSTGRTNMCREHGSTITNADPVAFPGPRIDPRPEEAVVDLSLRTGLDVVAQHCDLRLRHLVRKRRVHPSTERGDRHLQFVFVTQALVDRRDGHRPEQALDVVAVLVDVRPGHLPQPSVDEPREPLLDQLRPVGLAHRRAARADPGRFRRRQVLPDRLAVHPQRRSQLALRAACVPVDVDLGDVDHDETFSSPSGLPIGHPNHGARNVTSSATTRSLDTDLRATHGQLGEFGMGNYMTLKPPNLGKSLIVDRGHQVERGVSASTCGSGRNPRRGKVSAFGRLRKSTARLLHASRAERNRGRDTRTPNLFEAAAAYVSACAEDDQERIDEAAAWVSPEALSFGVSELACRPVIAPARERDESPRTVARALPGPPRRETVGRQRAFRPRPGGKLQVRVHTGVVTTAFYSH